MTKERLIVILPRLIGVIANFLRKVTSFARTSHAMHTMDSLGIITMVNLGHRCKRLRSNKEQAGLDTVAS